MIPTGPTMILGTNVKDNSLTTYSLQENVGLEKKKKKGLASSPLINSMEVFKLTCRCSA